MKIMVTGGSGFIGTNLVASLIQAGHEVIIYDKQKSEKYPDLCVKGDVRDREKLVQAMQEVSAIFHLAAEHRDDLQVPSLYYEVNEKGAENVVYSAKYHNVKKLIFTSTAAVYGLNLGEKSEKTPVDPFNDYGKSKYNAEKIFNVWAKEDETRSLCIVRPTVIFGEKNRGNVYNLLKQLATGRFIMIGNGENRKSMGYVFNLTRFLETLIEMGPGKFMYNYADKPDISINELIEVAHEVLEKKQKNYFRIPYTLGIMGGYGYDILSKITGKKYSISAIRIKKFCSETILSAEKLKETGFSAPYALTDGLKRMIRREFLHDLTENDAL